MKLFQGKFSLRFLLFFTFLMGSFSLEATPFLNKLYFTDNYLKPNTNYIPINSQETLFKSCSLKIPSSYKFGEKGEVFMGLAIDCELIEKIRDFTISWYRDKGFPIVGVSIPTGQNITKGVLKVNVIIARVGTVKAMGSKWFDDNWFLSQISLHEKEEIQLAPLMQDLNWINRFPFKKTTLIYEKGENLGETDLLLITKDHFPLRSYAGYENNGNIVGGNSRYFAGISVGRLFTQSDQFDYQFMTASPLKEWWGNRVTYLLPLPFRHLLQLSGCYAFSKPTLSLPAFAGIPFDQRGKNWQINGRYTIVLPSFIHYLHEVLIGYDFKRTNNFFDFFQTVKLFKHHFDISQFILGYEGTYESNFGFVSGGINFFISPGNMTAFNKDEFFEEENKKAKSRYLYGRVYLNALVKLSLGFSWSCDLLGQFSSGQLLPSEQLSLGGYLTIRGYDENELISNQGFYLKNSWYTPAFSLLKWVKKWHKANDRLQFLLFIDFGYAYDLNENIIESQTKPLASIGPGLRYKIGKHVNLWVDYGFQLKSIQNRPFTSSRQGRVHFGLIVGY